MGWYYRRRALQALRRRRVLPAVVFPAWFVHRFVYLNSPAIKVRAVGSADGGLGFRIAAHFHKAEALGVPRVPVGDDFNRFHRAERGEEAPEVIFVGIVGKIAYI